MVKNHENAKILSNCPIQFKNFEPFFQEVAAVNGKTYGVPIFRGQGALFYNTDMFAAAGLLDSCWDPHYFCLFDPSSGWLVWKRYCPN